MKSVGVVFRYYGRKAGFSEQPRNRMELLKREAGRFNLEFKRIRAAIIRRDKGVCTCCGVSENLHVHHKLPRSRGGTNGPGNLITLCGRCHAMLHPENKAFARLVESA